MTALAHRLPGDGRAGADPLIAEARDRQHRRRRRVAAVLLVLVGAGAIGYGIGRGAPATSSTRARSGARVLPNPCALLTSRQAGAALGTHIQYTSTAFSSGLTPAPSRFRLCIWHGAPLAMFRGGSSVTVMIARSTRKQFVKYDRTGVPVRRLGELAYARPAPTYALNVFEHGYAITIQTGAVHPIASAEHLARLALTRLR